MTILTDAQAVVPVIKFSMVCSISNLCVTFLLLDVMNFPVLRMPKTPGCSSQTSRLILEANSSVCCIPQFVNAADFSHFFAEIASCTRFVSYSSSLYPGCAPVPSTLCFLAKGD